ncbi:STAS domain-containing protein [Pseudonocardia broussonetiae]|uniref:STAS domain-containing protein n=1 Tax=Pseudonocardia broussonetiae TaxID=2736640 RepID=A0A6M6JJA4_9PSEU|nr:STAS domain-containing protein [Pseudonocardia broussonetiae]QJY47516.1 STAS domain-containing protein [Pseudonocardia broussonetiae]
MGLDVRTRPGDDGTVTVAVAGDVDLSAADALRTAVGDAVASGSPVVLDLTAVRYLDSAGVKVLFECVGRPVEVAVDARSLLPRVLAITGLDRRLVVHER